ncbi:DUF5709 domain-containing protein [Streptomyces sp. NPDC004647]|uniref:DUF5709 domain-containing protein n=1 Tax=Streptomyces sp. NPDC004647 TaxID=3154671 RepID=UPI0033BF0184
MSESMMGDEVYQPDGSEVQDDAGLLEPEDTLDDRGLEAVLDEGYSPPERPWAVESRGTTADEQHRGEPLDERLAHEIPDIAVPEGDGIGDTLDSDGELWDEEVGERRAGRLVAPDEGAHSDEEKDMVASDVGIDGAAASAEEAAVHVVPDAEETDERQ